MYVKYSDTTVKNAIKYSFFNKGYYKCLMQNHVLFNKRDHKNVTFHENKGLLVVWILILNMFMLNKFQ